MDYQGINVADRASGAGGDITIRSGAELVFAAEVTERTVDRSRVVATFNTKIAPAGIEEYLFFVRAGGVSEEARLQARKYFTQGHEVSFLTILDWIVMCLATVGRHGRATFSRRLVELLSGPDLPQSVRERWNEQIDKLVS